MRKVTRRNAAVGVGSAIFATLTTPATAAAGTSPCALIGAAIRHVVAFKLKWAPGSDEERDFFSAAGALAALPQVRRFERFHQIGHKNPFTYGFSMEFEDQSAYALYNAHPVHQAFLRTHWNPGVSDFIEIDLSVLV